jgi:glycerol kinase
MPYTGWCEHDPDEILHNVVTSIEICMSIFLNKGFQVSDIKAVGITNQRETTVVWDKNTGKPMHNAIMWLDTRTHGICEKLAEENGGNDAFRKVCGLPISTYFSAVKIKWLLDHVPEIRAAADKGDAAFGTVDSWLLHALDLEGAFVN